jgi:hypothetical protein
VGRSHTVVGSTGNRRERPTRYRPIRKSVDETHVPEIAVDRLRIPCG